MNHTDTEGSGVTPQFLANQLQQFVGKLQCVTEVAERLPPMFGQLASEIHGLSEVVRQLVQQVADLSHQTQVAPSLTQEEGTVSQSGSPVESVQPVVMSPVSPPREGPRGPTSDSVTSSQLSNRGGQCVAIVHAAVKVNGSLPFTSPDDTRFDSRASGSSSAPKWTSAPVLAASTGPVRSQPSLTTPSSTVSTELASPPGYPSNSVNSNSSSARSGFEGATSGVAAPAPTAPAQIAQELGVLWTKLFAAAASQRRAIRPDDAMPSLQESYGNFTLEDKEQYAIISFAGRSDCFVLPMKAAISDGVSHIGGFFVLESVLPGGASPEFREAAVVSKANLAFPPTGGSVIRGRIAIPAAR
jgi:hypothetical protein